jgi:pimeloyl-ACP methyl ester carboxylesterase/DNA-binding CsgD family transcriptional regulator
MIDAPDQHLKLLRHDVEAYTEDAVEHEAEGPTANNFLPTFEALGFILFDRALHRVPLPGKAWLPEIQKFEQLDARTVRRSADGRLIVLDSEYQRCFHAFWAPVSETSHWNLPDNVRRVALTGQERLVLIATGAANGGPLVGAAKSFPLTDLEQRIVVEMVRHGNARRVAARLKLAYPTVREALAQSARKCRQPNTAALIRMIVAASYGVFPSALNHLQIITDMLQISPRQARIALMLVSGESRSDVAQALNISRSVVKKELEYIYETLGLSSVSELARLIVETQALALFTRATDGAPGVIETGIEPSRFLVRANGREVVGWSDHGPASGKPVLVVHSNWSCRAIPGPLVAELQKRGFRPIAIDRPGFGATSPGSPAATEAFTLAVDDTLRVLDHLRISKIPIIARCGAQFVHALKSLAPDKVAQVVLVSPTPPTTLSGLRHGVVGTVKEAFYRSPRLIQLIFRVICAQVTLPRIEHLTRAIVKGSPTDERLCEDPAFIRDRFRSIRPFSTGNFSGAIKEERLISMGGHSLSALYVSDWTVLQGQCDTHNDVLEVESYWRAVLPDSHFLSVADGGRFMTHSHAALVTQALVDAADREPRTLPSTGASKAPAEVPF